MITEIRKLIPGYKQSSARRSTESGQSTFEYIGLTRNFGEYQGGDYFLNEECPLVHFTSYESAKNILQSGEIWMSRLADLNDPREFNYGCTHYAVESKLIKEAKEDAYSFSFCLKPMVIRKRGYKREFTLWRFYGAQGKGVMIEFEVDNDRTLWKDFYFSRVYYGVKNKRKLKAIHKLNTSSKNIKPTIQCDISPLLFFHKARLYENEYEVKLVYDGRPAGILGPTEISRNGRPLLPIFRKGENSRKAALKLSNDLNLSKIDQVPSLRIKTITLGFQHRDAYEVKAKEILAAAKTGLGYEPKVELSHLAKLYYGD